MPSKKAENLDEYPHKDYGFHPGAERSLRPDQGEHEEDSSRLADDGDEEKDEGGSVIDG